MNLIKTESFELACNIQGNEAAQKLAFVLPGRLDTKDYPHMKSHVEYLSNRSFLALSFDPPGTWESPGDIGLYTMTNYLKAINELIEYFGNRPTLVFGHSRGGSMALLAATRNQHVTHFASVMGGYSYAPNVYKDLPGKEAWKTQGYKLEKRDQPNDPHKIREYKLPYSFLEDSQQYNMLDDLRKCTKPKLFVYGTRDITVKPETVKTAYEAASEPKMLLSLDSDHNYRFNPHLIETVSSFVDQFLNAYNF